MSKKVLIIKKDIKDTKSGAPRILFDQIRFFKNQDFEVHICAETLNPEDYKPLGAIAHKTFKWPFDGYKRRSFFAKHAQKLQKKLRPNLTIGHGDSFYDDVSYIHNCVHLAHQKIHESYISKDHPVALIHEKNFKEQNFKALVCNSEMMKNDLIQRFQIPESIIKVEYPKYDGEKFKVGASKREDMRKKINIDDQEILVGLITSGNFKKRNVDFFLRVIAKTNKISSLKFKVLIAGKNKEDKYHELAKELGITDQVTFAPSITNVEDYYNAIDIFVLPAKIEEFGLSVVEAMRCGAPVIVSEFVGSGELLKGEYANYRLPLSEEKFSHALKNLIENKNLRSELIKLGTEITDEYPKQNNFEHLLEFYQSTRRQVDR